MAMGYIPWDLYGVLAYLMQKQALKNLVEPKWIAV